MTSEQSEQSSSFYSQRGKLIQILAGDTIRRAGTSALLSDSQHLRVIISSVCHRSTSFCALLVPLWLQGFRVTCLSLRALSKQLVNSCVNHNSRDCRTADYAAATDLDRLYNIRSAGCV